MPELPQMQALAERLQGRVGGAVLAGVQPIGFSGLKTFAPAPESLIGRTLEHTGRRGKYLILDFGGPRIFVHLSQAGRLDVEEPPKTTRGGKGGVVRLRFDNDVALLVREYGTERKAGWWVVGEGEVGPVEGLGPEPASDEFAELILHGEDRRRVHTMLRDQRTVAGIGRGHADDALWRAKLSPYATLASLGPEERHRLLDEVRGDVDGRGRARAGAHRRVVRAQARRQVRRPRPLRDSVPPVQRHAPARLLRVLRGHVLPDVPDGRQAARRPPHVPPREVAARGATSLGCRARP